MKTTADRKVKEGEKMSKADLFWRVVLTGLVTFVIVFMAAFLIALVVWGVTQIGVAVAPLLILIGLLVAVIAGSWSIAGWLMK